MNKHSGAFVATEYSMLKRFIPSIWFLLIAGLVISAGLIAFQVQHKQTVTVQQNNGLSSPPIAHTQAATLP